WLTVKWEVNSWRNCVASQLLAMAMLAKDVAGQFTGARFRFGIVFREVTLYDYLRALRLAPH
ncbi:MAG TPA: hypothetical protein VES89_01575, partial [Candidatus Competibacteraceae bacterium]|nr:hypothetical protein [Candidatus Competibacteraceae bacterium]